MACIKIIFPNLLFKKKVKTVFILNQCFLVCFQKIYEVNYCTLNEKRERREREKEKYARIKTPA